MKKVILFGLFLILLISAGCAPKTDEALATQQAMAVKLTVQASDIEALKTQVARPTATCEV
jgi:predicted outer membrane protein